MEQDQSLSKRIKYDNPEIDTLMSKYSNLIDWEFAYLKGRLNCYLESYERTKPIINSYISNSSLSLMNHQIKNLRDIKYKQETLCEKILIDLEAMKSEQALKYQNAIKGLSSLGLASYLKTEISLLEQIQSKKSESTMDDKSNLVRDSACLSSDKQPTTSTCVDAPIIEDMDCMVTELPPSLKQRSKEMEKSPMLLQQKRLAEYQEIVDNPLANKFSQNLEQILNLFILEDEQFTIVRALSDEFEHIQQKNSTDIDHSDIEISTQNNKPMADEIGNLDRNEKKIEIVKPAIKAEAKSNSLVEQAICSFYVSRKKRSCRMAAAKGKKYCCQHLVVDSTPDVCTVTYLIVN